MLDPIGRGLTKRFADNPVFIVARARSGDNTLLQSLGKHPAILNRPTEDHLYSALRLITFEISMALITSSGTRPGWPLKVKLFDVSKSGSV
jgi:hypothetical protein